MTTTSATLEAIDSAIIDCAKAASSQATSGSAADAERLASAARQLAEVQAWLRNPAQPHGANSSVAE